MTRLSEQAGEAGKSAFLRLRRDDEGLAPKFVMLNCREKLLGIELETVPKPTQVER